MSDISQHPLNKGCILTPRTTAILASCGGGTIYGLAAGVIGGVQEAMVKSRFFPDAPSTEQASMSGVLTACLLLGAFLGCFLGVDAGNRWGHRFSLRLTGINCVLCSVALAFVPNFALIVIVRTMLGVSVGFATALCPWYVTDAIPAATRGSIGTIFQINICAFILVGEIINYLFHPDASDTNIYIPDWKWKLQLTLSAAPGLFLWILSYVMHESPVYLAKMEEAESKGAQQQQQQQQQAQTEQTQMISVTLGSDSSAAVLSPSPAPSAPAAAGYRELFSRKNLNWVFIGLILSSSNQLTGINAIIFYAPKIFQDADLPVNPLVMTIAVVGSWNLISVFISFGLVDRLGRRPLMLGALFLMGVGAGLMCLAYQFFPQSNMHAPVAIIALLLFVGAFECGPGPLFFLMAVETFPADIRDPALSLTQSSAWVFSILITFGFPVLNTAIGSAATFLVFFINCVLGFVLIWWKVPEPMATHEEDSATAVEKGRTNSLSKGNGKTNAAGYQKL